jgi:hypothetical protein
MSADQKPWLLAIAGEAIAPASAKERRAMARAAYTRIRANIELDDARKKQRFEWKLLFGLLIPIVAMAIAVYGVWMDAVAGR